MSRPAVSGIKMNSAAGLAVHFTNIPTAGCIAILQYPAFRNSFQYFVVNFIISFSAFAGVLKKHHASAGVFFHQPNKLK